MAAEKENKKSQEEVAAMGTGDGADRAGKPELEIGQGELEDSAVRSTQEAVEITRGEQGGEGVVDVEDGPLE